MYSMEIEEALNIIEFIVEGVLHLFLVTVQVVGEVLQVLQVLIIPLIMFVSNSNWVWSAVLATEGKGSIQPGRSYMSAAMATSWISASSPV